MRDTTPEYEAVGDLIKLSIRKLRMGNIKRRRPQEIRTNIEEAKEFLTRAEVLLV